ncbi:histone deacetylase family protein [Lysobacter sp. GX 14042]|uniref:histone deacetylase family protein n=1 Tax=Lysobacter sp. GX 14042 TaxID=2907155 RepID=UPI001F2856CE|nr:histone deacetylase family protein [Lysobacter sp. GX 14042]MCE7031081.1 histone deacetylase family protein [Lysobacter sp. GX 14042]
MDAARVHLYTHPACLGHVPGAAHVEVPARLEAVTGALSDAFPGLPWHSAPEATRAQLLRVHDPSLLALVLDSRFAEGDPPMHLDPDTVVGPGSAGAALRAAGAGIAAVDAVIAGGAARAFCAVRPPGHHAGHSTPMGFCLLNNVAVAAAHAVHGHGLSRVAIVDFDVHHGNGTQEILAGEPSMLYLSSHQSPLFPDTGRSDGGGNALNRLLAPGTGSSGFRQAWDEHLLPALHAWRPQLVLVSAGFDGHRLDPLADLRLDADDFAWLTTRIRAIADRHAGGRLVSTLEGGYSLPALAEAVTAHVGALA